MKTPSKKEIIRAVCHECGVTQVDLMNHGNRAERLVEARTITTYLMRTVGRFSYEEIAEAMNASFHTTPIWQIRRISRMPKLRRRAEDIGEQIIEDFNYRAKRERQTGRFDRKSYEEEAAKVRRKRPRI